MVGTLLVLHFFYVVGEVWKKKCSWKVWNASGVCVPRKVDSFCVFSSIHNNYFYLI